MVSVSRTSVVVHKSHPPWHPTSEPDSASLVRDEPDTHSSEIPRPSSALKLRMMPVRPRVEGVTPPATHPQARSLSGATGAGSDRAGR